MKMYLVINKHNDDHQIGGLFTDKDSSIRRAKYLQENTNGNVDHWIVEEVFRQKIKTPVPASTLIFDTKEQPIDNSNLPF